MPVLYKCAGITVAKVAVSEQILFKSDKGTVLLRAVNQHKGEMPRLY